MSILLIESCNLLTTGGANEFLFVPINVKLHDALLKTQNFQTIKLQKVRTARGA